MALAARPQISSSYGRRRKAFDYKEFSALGKTCFKKAITERKLEGRQ